jgi:hypothetical protein
MRMKNKFVFVAILSSLAGFVVPSGFARESWPVATGADLERQREFKAYGEQVASNDAPAIAEWAKRGKPFIPWAAKPEDLPQAKVPAFPGAEGGGKFSFGGRGGKVYVVTNLADSGPGTYREACEAAGPRIVVFNVAGIIHLDKPVWIEAPYITIDGHTAPGDGICIAGETTFMDAHDIVIRYMRFRRGNTSVFDRQSGLCGNPVGNIIIDHCSASWGNDQTMDTYRHLYTPPTGGPTLKLPTVNDTFQWCIVYEGLNLYNHAFGGDWGGRNSGFHHNLFACNTGRNPSVAMSFDFNFVNNVLFNWRHRSVDGGDANSRFNIISNYYKPGPATLDNPVRYRILEPAQSWNKVTRTGRFGKAYVSGNIVEGYPKVTADNWDGGVQFAKGPDADATGDITKGLVDDPALIQKLFSDARVDKPFPMAPITMQSAQDAYTSVLAEAGATLPVRDSVDQRAIQETSTGHVWSEGKMFTPKYRDDLPKNDIGSAGNGIITDITQVGGYPDYKGEPVKDLGSDGLPLSWKEKYHLSTNDRDLAQEYLQGDGYTVMDKYLAGLDPNKKIDWNDPKSNVNTLK